MSKYLSKFTRRLDAKLNRRATQRHVKSSIQLLHGPKRTVLTDSQVALVIVGRDVGYFLEHHIHYHLALGVSHVVYVDNGSSDDSIEIAKRFPNITVASCTASFRLHQSQIRYLANTLFIEGGWRLAIDPDELLDYPGSDRIDLPELVTRMAARGHNAMVAQMLDMVCAGSLSKMANFSFAEAETHFDQFSLAEITEVPYLGSDLGWAWFLDQNRISNDDIRILFGGVRQAAFGENCCLTKHALFRIEKGVVPQAHPHVTTGVTCTDFSAVLKHYKFAGDMPAREKKLLAENRIAHDEMQLRIAKIEREGDISLGQYTECKGFSVEYLLEQGFLKASEDALKMLE